MRETRKHTVSGLQFIFAVPSCHKIYVFDLPVTVVPIFVSAGIAQYVSIDTDTTGSFVRLF